MNHVGFLLNGYNEYAEIKNLNLTSVYVLLANKIEYVCEWCIQKEIPFLTIKPCSINDIENILPAIDGLHAYLNMRRDWYINHNIRIKFKGKINNLDEKIVNNILDIESSTNHCFRLTLIIDLSSNGRDEIIKAITSGAKTEKELSKSLIGDVPELDLFVLTNGNHSLSGFMTWETAYSKLCFTDKFFADLTNNDLNKLLL